MLEAAAPAAAFDLCHAQNGAEHAQDIVQFAHALVDHRLAFLGRQRLHAGGIELASQAAQGCAQIVRDVVGQMLQALGQAAGAVEHAVQRRRQPVEIVGGAAPGNAAPDVALDDGFQGAGDAFDAFEKFGAEQHAARGRQSEGEQKHPTKGLQDHIAEIGHLAPIIAHQQAQPIRQRRYIDAKLLQLARGFVAVRRPVQGGPAARAGHHRQIPEQMLARFVVQREIEPVGQPAALAIRNGAHHLRHAARFVISFQRARFGINARMEFAAEFRGHREIGYRRQQANGNCEKPDIGRSQLEAGRFKRLR